MAMRRLAPSAVADCPQAHARPSCFGLGSLRRCLTCQFQGRFAASRRRAQKRRWTLHISPVCWRVLQCVGVCWSVLECIGVCWSVLECVGVRGMCCSVLQCVAVRCNVFQCVAVRCNVLQPNLSHTPTP